MAPPQTAAVRAEDEVSRKWDACISDSIIKLGGGLGLGAVFSLLFFKRRAWPLVFGSGIGLGASYSNCQHAFRNPYVAPPVRKWPVATVTPKSSSLPLKTEVSKPRSALADYSASTEIKDVESAINGFKP